ncbi:MAG: glycosyl transferase, partial [Bacteroidota bacterium]
MKLSFTRIFGSTPKASLWDNESLIRSELFSIERLEQHAESLAKAQPVLSKPTAGHSLAVRLADNGRVLLRTYHTIAKAISEELVITPAAEWLVDNFYIVDEQIRNIHDDLPSGYYRQLPKLADGALKGYPRVFGIAWAFVAHTDSRFDLETLSRFVSAYQRIQPLTIGELWAVAITLRIILVENLRRSAERIVKSREQRADANNAAERLLGIGTIDVERPEITLLRFHGKKLPTAFAVQLVQRLRDQDPAVTPALQWLDERLTAQGTTSEKIVNEEHQYQGAMSVTVRNIITSMRQMSSIDWPKFFESVSLVDEALSAESNFAAMDFPTRDSYRHAIEDLSRGSKFTELEITQKAIQNAHTAKVGKRNVPDQDPGFYLISRGRLIFERQISFHIPLRLWFDRIASNYGIRGYIISIASLCALILAIPVLAVARQGTTIYEIVLLAILAVLPLSDVAVALVNHWVTQRFGPKGLPALELKEGVP